MSKFLLFFITLFSITGNAQAIISCSIEKVKRADQKADNLTGKIVFEFLMTFDKTCEQNIEYSEYSNEVLFKILEINPKKLIKKIDQIRKRLDENYIYSNIRRPVADDIDLKGIKERIQNLNYNSQSKDLILASIDIAIENDNAKK